MKMNLKLLFCPGFLLLLIVSQNQARARPISSLQGLSKLLDEDLEHPLVSEEKDHEQNDMIPTGAFGQQDVEFQWTQNTRDQPESMSMGDSAVQRFFSNLLSLARRYRGRSKKGLSRGCFGVKLDRIGSLSGLGC
ncbi:C-type natriuretic peptide 1-like [Gymnogyps californianus]|uniref:C-type natriuretic peptide 1-like n=1 Tax=Gymnogyps californianus TaxID=33616 RepID=UPI0021C627BC|nr:C-type natriuretic peptide 1-like [Gymnogyps californianus]